MSETSGTFWNFSEHSETFCNILEFFGTFWNILEFENVPTLNRGARRDSGFVSER